jgi:8-oxo-dGTP diphosphatase
VTDAGGPLRPVAVAVIVRCGKALVQTRGGPGRWNGYWEFPGGGIELGESAEDAVQRECLEEVALPIQVLRSIECPTWSAEQGTVDIQFLLCSVAENSEEPQPRLGQQLSWVGAAELREWQFLPANAGVISWLLRYLADRSPAG